MARMNWGRGKGAQRSFFPSFLSFGVCGSAPLPPSLPSQRLTHSIIHPSPSSVLTTPTLPYPCPTLALANELAAPCHSANVSYHSLGSHPRYSKFLWRGGGRGITSYNTECRRRRIFILPFSFSFSFFFFFFKKLPPPVSSGLPPHDAVIIIMKVIGKRPRGGQRELEKGLPVRREREGVGGAETCMYQVSYGTRVREVCTEDGMDNSIEDLFYKFLKILLFPCHCFFFSFPPLLFFVL